VPWITPVTDEEVFWRKVLDDRLVECQVAWLCQVCGLPLAPWAHVVIDVDGRVVTDAALHEQCLRAAVLRCPVLRQGVGSGAYRTVRVGRDDILASREAGQSDGRQAWTVPGPQ
jgi:hypothetical protein